MLDQGYFKYRKVCITPQFKESMSLFKIDDIKKENKTLLIFMVMVLTSLILHLYHLAPNSHCRHRLCSLDQIFKYTQHPPRNENLLIICLDI